MRDADIELAQITELLAVELRNMEEKQAAAASLSGQRGDAESAMHRVGHEVQRLEHRVSAVRGQLSAVAQQREGAEARLGILQAELDQLGEAATRAESGLNEARNRVLETEESLSRRALELTEVEGNLRLSTMGMATAEGEIRQLERTLSEKASRLDVLKSVIIDTRVRFDVVEDAMQFATEYEVRFLQSDRLRIARTQAALVYLYESASGAANFEDAWGPEAFRLEGRTDYDGLGASTAEAARYAAWIALFRNVHENTVDFTQGRYEFIKLDKAGGSTPTRM
jgi:chromosome segregation ATPase